MPILDANKRKEFVDLLGEPAVIEIEAKATKELERLVAAGTEYKEFTMIDTDAREQLTALSKQMAELETAVKAKMTPKDEEDDAAKKKKMEDDGMFKKEVTDAIKQLATSQSQLAANFKEFMDLTPRRASKSTDTLVDENDPALKELAEGATGQKSNEDKIMHGAFGFMGVGG